MQLCKVISKSLDEVMWDAFIEYDSFLVDLVFRILWIEPEVRWSKGQNDGRQATQTPGR
jgi:hypothetical protein